LPFSSLDDGSRAGDSEGKAPNPRGYNSKPCASLVNAELVEMMGVEAHPQIARLNVRLACTPPRGGLIGPENPRCTATGEYCTPPSDRRRSTLDRRRILHFPVTAHPTAEWTAQQLHDAFPWDSAPRYLLRDRDRIFGHDFVEQAKAMEIKQVLSAGFRFSLKGSQNRHSWRFCLVRNIMYAIV
jgi:hypothetical protein